MSRNKHLQLGLLGVLTGILLLACFHPTLAAPAAHPSATEVSGEISTDTTWTLAGSPYLLTSNLVIDSGVTLTVEPGVIVMGQSTFELRLYGRLEAIGTEASPILFTSAEDSAPNQWAGLVFDGPAASGELDYVTVRYGGMGNSVWLPIAPNIGGDITVNNLGPGLVRLQHSQVLSEFSFYCDGYGCNNRADFGLYSANSRVVVQDTLFSDNGNGPDSYALLATAGSDVTLSGSTFQNNFNTGLSAQGGSTLHIDSCTFQNNSGNALYVAGAGPVSLTHSSFTNNTGWAVGVSLADLDSFSQSDNTLTGNGYDRLVLLGRNLPANRELGVYTLGGREGYILGEPLVVPAGLTLTIDPGVTIYGVASAELLVNGRLDALGTEAEPILFTSAADTGPNQWSGIVFDGPAASGALDYVTVRYGGAGNSVNGPGWGAGGDIVVNNLGSALVSIQHSQLHSEYSHPCGDYGCQERSDFALYVVGSRVTVEDSLFADDGNWIDSYALYATAASDVTLSGVTFQNNAGTALAILGGSTAHVAGCTFQNNSNALYVAGASPVTLTGTTFTHNSGWGVGVSLDSLDLFVPSANTLNGNGLDRLVLLGRNLPADRELGIYTLGGREGYILGEPLIVPAGLTLTIDPGVTILGVPGADLLVNGHLEAVGTPANPILFTSAADTAPNQWGGIVFDGPAASGSLDYVTVRYGGTQNSAGPGTWGGGSDVSVNNLGANLVSIQHSQILSEYSYVCGDYGCQNRADFALYVDNSRVIVQDALFSDNGNDPNTSYGLFATAGSEVTLARTTFENSGGTILYIDGGSQVRASQVTIQNNANNGVFLGQASTLNLTGSTIDANTNGVIVSGGSTFIAAKVIVEYNRAAGVSASDSKLNLNGVTVLRNLGVGLSLTNTYLELVDSSLQENGASGLTLDGGSATLNRVTIPSSGDRAIRANNASLSILDSTLSGSAADGLLATHATVTMQNTILQNHTGNGINSSDSTLTLRNSTLEGNHAAGLLANSGKVTLEQSTFQGNLGGGVTNQTPATPVYARYNWWGSPSGPYNPVSNPGGTGDAVSAGVLADPWLITPGNRQPIPLTLDQTLTEPIALSGFVDFSLDLPAGLALQVEITPGAGADALWLYSRLGDLPSWTQYDQVSQQPTSAEKIVLFISPTQQGSYRFSVYGRQVSSGGGSFQIKVSAVQRSIQSIFPTSAGNAGVINLYVKGWNFQNGMTFQLSAPGLPTILPTSVSYSLWWSTVVTLHFDLHGATPGTYTLRAAWPDSPMQDYPVTFTVVLGQGAHLEASLHTPPVLRPGREYVLWLDYANTGDADLPGPIFIVKGPPGSLMRLFPWYPYTTDSLQIVTNSAFGIYAPFFLGTSMDAQPQAGQLSLRLTGDLSPGQHKSISIYFQVPPGAHSQETLSFELRMLSGYETPIDWAAVETQIKPADVDPQLWAVLFPILKGQIGSTWGDYQQALAQDAAYLTSLGQDVSDARQVFGYEMRKALGISPHTYLAQRVDATAPSPASLSLQISLAFSGSLEGRFALGPFGRGWTYSYDIRLMALSSGDVQINLPGGVNRLFKHNSNGTYTSAQGGTGKLTLNGGVFELAELDGSLTRFRPDGQLDFLRDASGNQLSAVYDAQNRLIQLAASNGQSFTLLYNPQGRVAHLIDQAGRTTDYAYDASGEHLISVTSPGGRVTVYAYQPVNGDARDHALLQITFPDGHHLLYAYDSRGRLAQEELDGGAERATYAYDTSGRIQVTDAAGHSSFISPDELGRLASTDDALGNQANLTYSGQSGLSGLVDAAGSAYKLESDPSGNVTSIRNPLNQVIHLGYDLRFNQVSGLEDERGNRLSFSYDLQGHLAVLTYPDGSQEKYTYDSNGRLVQVTRRDGSQIGITYNAQGLLTRKDYPDGSFAEYGYDSIGHMTSATDATGTILMEYDPQTDELTKITYPSGHWFSFSYNSLGQRTQRLGDDGYILHYFYDAAGRLQRLTDGNGTELVRYEYDANGRVTRQINGNGTTATYTYDAAGQLIRLVNAASDDSVQSRFDYTYDQNGNRTAQVTPLGTTLYTYDPLGQLIGMQAPDGSKIEYSYDAAGNRTQVTQGGVVTKSTVNNLNQTLQTGDTSYTYDLNGNLASKSDASGTTSYRYDNEVRLVQVDAPGGDSWKYTYDALGNRTALDHDGVLTRYASDPAGLGDLAAEYDGSGSLLARYVDGVGLAARLDAGGSPAYYGFDGSGNTRQLTDAGGAVVNSYDYDPFGGLSHAVQAIPNPFSFGGELGAIQDGTGLSFMRLRYYSPDQGSFITPDPIGLAGGDANPYRYAKNDPVSHVSPAGSWGSNIADWLDHRMELTQQLLLERVGVGHWIIRAAIMSWKDFVNAFLPIDSFRLGQGIASGDYAKEIIRAIGLIGPLSGPIKLGYKINSFWEFLHGGGVNDWKYFSGWYDPLLEAGYKGWDLADKSGELLGYLYSIYDTQFVKGWLASLITPSDPNEKAGPPGVGPQHVIHADAPLTYTVYFENQSTASAPAQEVIITDHLDPGLDWSTFNLSEITWGSQTLTIPAGASNFHTRQVAPDYRSGEIKYWWVDVDVQVDYVSGVVQWTLRTLDPETGFLPEDALAGFLPPEDSSGRGQGHVTFSVRPRAGTPNGVTLTNQASIVFDTEAPVATNTYSNLIGSYVDLSLTQAINPDSAKTAHALTYTLTITNQGPDPANAVVLSDALPASAGLVSATPSQGTCSGATTLTCNLGTLAPGASASVVVVVTPQAIQTITNSASVSSTEPDANPADNQSALDTPVQRGLWKAYLPRVSH